MFENASFLFLFRAEGTTCGGARAPRRLLELRRPLPERTLPELRRTGCPGTSGTASNPLFSTCVRFVFS